MESETGVRVVPFSMIWLKGTHPILEVNKHEQKTMDLSHRGAVSIGAIDGGKRRL
jgi:hypothetical protein